MLYIKISNTHLVKNLKFTCIFLKIRILVLYYIYKIKQQNFKHIIMMNNKIKIEIPIDFTFNMENLLEDAIKEAKTNGCQYQDEVEDYIESGNISVKTLFKNIINNSNISDDVIYNSIIKQYDSIIYNLGLSPLSTDNFKIIDSIFSI